MDKVVTLESAESKEDKAIRETAEYYAKLHRAMVDAHRKQGFTKADALFLCATADPE